MYVVSFLSFLFFFAAACFCFSRQLSTATCFFNFIINRISCHLIHNYFYFLLLLTLLLLLLLHNILYHLFFYGQADNLGRGSTFGSVQLLPLLNLHSPCHSRAAGVFFVLFIFRCTYQIFVSFLLLISCFLFLTVVLVLREIQ